MSRVYDGLTVTDRLCKKMPKLYLYPLVSVLPFRFMTVKYHFLSYTFGYIVWGGFRVEKLNTHVTSAMNDLKK